MTAEEAQAFAKLLARRLGQWCWSVDQDDIEMAALTGYVVARKRFQSPGDEDKYIRSYMRGAAREVLRQEARAHGLIRPHTRRCRQCKCSLPHRDKIHHLRRYCLVCGDRKARQRIYNKRYYQKKKQAA